MTCKRNVVSARRNKLPGVPTTTSTPRLLWILQRANPESTHGHPNRRLPGDKDLGAETYDELEALATSRSTRTTKTTSSEIPSRNT